MIPALLQSTSRPFSLRPARKKEAAKHFCGLRGAVGALVRSDGRSGRWVQVCIFVVCLNVICSLGCHACLPAWLEPCPVSDTR